MTRQPSAVVTGAASAYPAVRSQEELWDTFMAPTLGASRWSRRIFLAAGVRQRHPAFDPSKEDISSYSTGERMARYVDEAVPLGREAVEGALDAAGMKAADVGLLAVVSCTGYATPGVDIRLAKELGMDPGLQRLLVGHMGCYAALPGLGAVSDYVVARQRPAVLLCVELSSLHIQPPTADLEQVVAHALFSDAASALVVEPAVGGSRPGLRVVDVSARTAAETAGHMTWDITDLGFKMGLSRQVPDVLAVHVGPMVEDLLGRNGVERDEVAGWAVHPGGPRILDVIGEQLDLAATDLAGSRHVLAEHGNCSSATVLLVLDELVHARVAEPGRYIVAMAFGPGLTLYAALLQVVEPGRSAPRDQLSGEGERTD